MPFNYYNYYDLPTPTVQHEVGSDYLLIDEHVRFLCTSCLKTYMQNIEIFFMILIYWLPSGKKFNHEIISINKATNIFFNDLTWLFH